MDAIVVGSGATGGWAAKTLTEAGLTVALLEAGTRAEPIAVSQAATSGASARQFVQSRCYAFNETTSHLFVDDVDSPYETPVGQPFTWIRMRAIGGRTALWRRVALRMSEQQFRAASIDGFGSNWPLGYEELESHYEAIERFVGVHGVAEQHAEVPDGCFVPVCLSERAREVRESRATQMARSLRHCATSGAVVAVRRGLDDGGSGGDWTTDRARTLSWLAC